jgi:hypothetical protein
MAKDGPRYVAGLQDKTDISCYKDFFEGDKAEEARQKAEDAAERHQRSTIVFDRKMQEIIHRKVIASKTEVVEKPAPQQKRRGRKKTEEPKVEEKKAHSKEDYF